MEKEQRKDAILVVDDEPINIFLLEDILTEEGFIVITAKNGTEALAKLEAAPTDAILLDIMMPDMNGLEVLERLVANPATCHIPVIMVTAKIDSEDVQIALNKGAVEYIRKPFNSMELLARLRTALRIKHQEDHLREMLQSKEEFIHMMSHDMRAPMISVAGLAEILLNDEQNAEHKKILTTIIDSSNFIVDYFNKLLDWSNLGAKSILLSRTSIPVASLFKTAQVIFSLRISEKKQKFQIVCEDGDRVMADPSYFQQVINNLVSNAVKYTPDGGTITLAFERNGERPVITVADTGMGISGITPQELFGTTFHKSTRGTKGEKGTGVGLRICKMICDAHAFQLSYTSEPGKGTRFVIQINA